MRGLTVDEVMFAGGADGSSPAETISTSTGVVAGAGSAWGIIATDTAAGASEYGATGAALGFAYGVGYAIGTEINEHLIEN